jgi:tetratricopeptide (TPR) repeat protein
MRMNQKFLAASRLFFARASRRKGGRSRSAILTLLWLLCVAGLTGCREKPTASAGNSDNANTLLTNAMARFHAPSAEAQGAERERLLNEAARHYEELLKRFPGETNACAQALRALGSIHATQGRTNEAVKSYAAVGAKYPSQDWEVLMAWKGAADMLWESNQRAEAKKFYAKIIERFGKKDAPQIIQQVVRGSQARLAE